MNKKIQILFMALISIVGFNVVTDNVNAETKVSLYDNIKSKVTAGTGNGVHTVSGTQNANYQINYYKGNVTDNNVLFADKCWKIVRTTSLGGTKLVYNGPAQNGKCSNITAADKVIENTSLYGHTYPFSGYMYSDNVVSNVIRTGPGAANNVGYAYGNDVEYNTETGKYTLKDIYQSEVDISGETTNITENHHYTCLSTESTCEEVYYIFLRRTGRQATITYDYYKLTNGQKIDDVITELKQDKKDSPEKEILDNWYKNNMLKYADFIEDEVWCNDQATESIAGLDKDTNAVSGITYNTNTRVNNTTPSLTCSKEDSYTVNSASGNKKLTYPVGLLTADEVMYAGYTSDGNFEDNYLNIPGINWLTMSLSKYDSINPMTSPNLVNIAYMVTESGIKETASATNVRPSIVLKNKTVIVKGNGTEDSPYELALAEENNEKAIVNPNTKDFILSRLIMYTLFLGTALIAMVVIKSKKKELN